MVLSDIKLYYINEATDSIIRDRNWKESEIGLSAQYFMISRGN
jgi:hypothetical protein